MSVHYKHVGDGPDFEGIYLFDNAGDKIPEHKHEEAMAHNIYVMTGSIALVIEGDTEIYRHGALVNFDWSKPHTVISLEPGTSTVHYYLKGKPKQYDGLPPEEFEGIL